MIKVDCAQTKWLSNKEYMQQFNNKVVRQRIPLSGSIDITHRCNLKCVHCYLGGDSKDRVERDGELDTAKWLSIIDEITEAGCLYLLITGGEPLLRNDFTKIYNHAKKRGMLVTVFTNGTLIDDKIIEVFKDMPPFAVEISLYGANSETYEKITGIKGSYEKCIKGIEKLVENRINLKLKTVLMTHNQHELESIRNTAERYGANFRFDAAIFPGFNGDMAPVDLRVNPKEAVDMEFSDKSRFKEWQDYYGRVRNLPESDSLYTCGSGLTSFHVDTNGNLQPCLMAAMPRHNIVEGGFKAGWKNVISGIRMKKVDKGLACRCCEKKALCGYCPAFFNLENGKEDIPSKYLCAMGQYRFDAIENNNSQRRY